MYKNFKQVIIIISAFLISCSKSKEITNVIERPVIIEIPVVDTSTVVTPTYKHSFKYKLNGWNGGAVGNNSFKYSYDLFLTHYNDVFAVQKQDDGLSTYYLFGSRKGNDCSGAFGKCYSIYFRMPTLAVGGHNVHYLQFWLNDAYYMPHNNGSYELNIKEIGNIGGNIKGSFSGKFDKFHYWTDEFLGVVDLSAEFEFERLN